MGRPGRCWLRSIRLSPALPTGCETPKSSKPAAELVRPPAGERPSTLDTAVIYGAHRGMGISDLPVIFDLPTSQAVKRTEEFARYVHPVLQAYCARCHNESYHGEFQLVQIKSKLDRTRDALRANLDASLKLIDRDYPPRSELLASSLRPHGRGPNMHPIFQGSNDRAYQILATWVNKLRVTNVAEAVVQAKLQPGSPGAEPGESFASQRSQGAEETEQVGTATGPFVTGPVTNKTLPPVRVVPGKGVIPETSVDPNEFPLPFAVSGTKPKVGTKPPLTKTPETKAVKSGGAVGADPAGGGRVAAEAAASTRKKTEPSHLADTAAGADPRSGSNDASDPDERTPPRRSRRNPSLSTPIFCNAPFSSGIRDASQARPDHSQTPPALDFKLAGPFRRCW